MEESPYILIIDDHAEIRDSLGHILRRYGFRTALAENAKIGRQILHDGAISLVVLDIMMPGEDGLSLCRYIREAMEVPIIMLSARSEETERIVGLEIGADDYLAKPFNPRELVARIRSVLRRTHSLPRSRTGHAGTLRFTGWRFDPAQRKLHDAQDVEIPLTSGETLLLEAFLTYPQRPLSRDQLLDLTRGRDAAPFDRSIDNLISRLRRKIESDPKSPKLIVTEWGSGYRFTAEVVEQA